MKKQLLVLALISATQTMPWNPFDTAGDIVVGAAETPGAVFAGEPYTVSERRADRKERRNQRRNSRKKSDSSSTKGKDISSYRD